MVYDSWPLIKDVKESKDMVVRERENLMVERRSGKDERHLVKDNDQVSKKYTPLEFRHQNWKKRTHDVACA